MTLRRIPILPTLLVLIAVGVMIRLGLWQLERKAEKEAQQAQFSLAVALSSEVRLPFDKAAREKAWFRHTTFECLAKGETSPRAGHNPKGETGWAQWGQCRSVDGTPVAEVNLGWSQAPTAVPFAGGTVSGIIAPDGPQGARVISVQPLTGLAPSELPDPATIPNSHLAYAVQWFLFALIALVIYGLALRKRLRR